MLLYHLRVSLFKEKQGYRLIFGPKIRKITYMEKAEIKEIAVYLKELDEGLVEFDYRGLTNLSDLITVFLNQLNYHSCPSSLVSRPSVSVAGPSYSSYLKEDEFSFM